MQLGGNMCHLCWGIQVYSTVTESMESEVLVPALPLTCHVIFKASCFSTLCPPFVYIMGILLSITLRIK